MVVLQAGDAQAVYAARRTVHMTKETRSFNLGVTVGAAATQPRHGTHKTHPPSALAGLETCGDRDHTILADSESEARRNRAQPALRDTFLPTTPQPWVRVQVA
eukprot:3922573-Rhodomonas_salina.1